MNGELITITSVRSEAQVFVAAGYPEARQHFKACADVLRRRKHFMESSMLRVKVRDISSQYLIFSLVR